MASPSTATTAATETKVDSSSSKFEKIYEHTSSLSSPVIDTTTGDIICCSTTGDVLRVTIGKPKAAIYARTAGQKLYQCYCDYMPFNIYLVHFIGQPQGIAIDKSGRAYITDAAHRALVTPASDTSIAKVVSQSGDDKPLKV
jgi:hypothetical protein